MGMYTELVCSFELIHDVPEEVLTILNNLLDQSHRFHPSKVPDHEFFKCDRFEQIFLGCSYYFSPAGSMSDLRHDVNGTRYLTVRSSLKNYRNEIQKFLDWISPYIGFEQYIGYYRYEYDKFPTLIFIENSKIKYVDAKIY
jgi:hypothetical protein